MSRVAVTGMGIVSALGWSPRDTWAALEAEASGLAPLTLFPDLLSVRGPVAEVKGDPAAHSGRVRGARTEHLAVYAAREAFADAGFGDCPEDRRADVGVTLGVCTGGMGDTEGLIQKALHGHDVDLRLLGRHECVCAADSIAESLGLAGPRNTVSTACTSGAQAILLARDLIRSGEADVVIAGGADALTRLTLTGFASLLIVSPDGCRPFDAERNGMNLGEGAAMLVLESETHARDRGARIHAWLSGATATCDAHHCTAPAPGGEGIRRAMEGALAEAGLAPSAVGYVNAHGTGTRDNDAAEGAAIEALFESTMPAVSSTKGFFGHTLAAAGAIEAVVTILALQHQRVPANVGLRTVDPALKFAPPVHACDARIDAALSNSLGFGGANCCLAFERSACP